MSDPTSLENLQPIIFPPAPGFWPIAPGWYLVAAIVATVCLLFTYRFIQKRKANKYRQDAINRIDLLQRLYDTGEKEKALRAIPVLVKATALHAYPRCSVASLYGERWSDFLNNTISSNYFSHEESTILSQLSFATPQNILAIQQDQLTPLFDHLKFWIRHHMTEDEQGEKHV